MPKNIEFYIATNGSDANPGTKEKPLRTLEGARDAIRGLKKKGIYNSGFTVWIRGGVYYRESTFELTTEDTGTEEAPIIYRSYENSPREIMIDSLSQNKSPCFISRGEQVRLVGGMEIKREWFQPVTDEEVIARLPKAVRGKVLQVDVKNPY